ncbi:MAG: hypothetical protein DCC55_13780 [Chloroflexi bacterium]|nr:MAG: hypothetical protein DCC55_13780 [Chloroflexota bacterium]
MYTVPALDPTTLVTTPRTRRTEAPTAQPVREERRFCPSIFCFTDEIVIRRVSPKAEVWLLTDESEDRSWMMMGGEPVCPHCGTTLLSVEGLE